MLGCYLENPSSSHDILKAKPGHAISITTATTALGIRSAVLIQILDTVFDLRVNHAWADRSKAAYKNRMRGDIEDE